LREIRCFDICCLKNDFLYARTLDDRTQPHSRLWTKMADYKAPFRLPKFTTAEYQQKKTEYVDKYGYSITFPKIGDIIHIGLNKPMTEDEKILWYDGKRDQIPSRRRANLQQQKRRGREKFNQMLASPIPNWLSNYASILTAWDNVQDVLITLAAIGRIAIKFLPRLAMSWLSWPIGLLWLLASIMSTLAAPSMCVLSPMTCKRKMMKEMRRRNAMLRARGKAPERGTAAFLRMQRDKLKYGFKGYAKSGGFLPSFSELIQGLQVTKDIWGVGLAIGPIFGLAYDLLSGGVRYAMGQKVTIRNSPWPVETYRKTGDTKYNYIRYAGRPTSGTKAEQLKWRKKAVRSGLTGVRNEEDYVLAQALRLSQTNQGYKHGTDFMLEAATYCGAEIAGHGVWNSLEDWNPMENVDGLEHLEIEAYNEPNPLQEEVLEELGLDPQKGISWPQLGRRWATYDDIFTSLAPVAAENFEYFVENEKNQDLLAVMENSAIEMGLESISQMEGEDFLEIDYHAALNIAQMILGASKAFPLDIEEPQMVAFAEYSQGYEEAGYLPSGQDVEAYAEHSLDFVIVPVHVWTEELDYKELED